MKKIKYDTTKYDFARLVKIIFDCKDLTKLHEKLPENIQYNELHKIGEDNKTWYHKKFYEPINNGDVEFVTMYRNFVREVVTPLMNGDDFIFQRVPTFRVHAPGNVAVGGWHRDIDYNHSRQIMVMPICGMALVYYTETNPTPQGRLGLVLILG